LLFTCSICLKQGLKGLKAPACFVHRPDLCLHHGVQVLYNAAPLPKSVTCGAAALLQVSLPVEVACAGSSHADGQAVEERIAQSQRSMTPQPSLLEETAIHRGSHAHFCLSCRASSVRLAAMPGWLLGFLTTTFSPHCPP
jgi:hypothetical protein